MDTFKKHIATTVMLLLFMFALIITALPAFAQVVPNIGDAVKQATPPPKETPERSRHSSRAEYNSLKISFQTVK